MLRILCLSLSLAPLALANGPKALPSAPAVALVQQETSNVHFDRLHRTIAFYEARVAKESQDLTAWSKLGPLHLQVGRATGAHESFLASEKAFGQVLQLSPGSMGAHIGIAYSNLGRHGFEKALQAARKAASISPNDALIPALLGDIHFALGNYAEAGFAYRSLAQVRPNLETVARLGLLQQSRGQYDQARELFQRAKSMGEQVDAPAEDLAWCESMLGDLAWELGQGSQAERHYSSALHLQPGARSAVIGMAQVLEARGRLATAIPMLERLTIHSPEPKHWLALAGALEVMGDLDRAQALRDQAEHDMLADLQIDEVGHLRELVMYWFETDGPRDRAVAIALEDLGHRRDIEGLEVAAWALFRNGELERADTLMQEALRWGSQTRQCLARAAQIREALGDEHAALELRQQAQEIRLHFTVPIGG